MARVHHHGGSPILTSSDSDIARIDGKDMIHRLKVKLWLWVDNFLAVLNILLPSARKRYMLNPLLKYPKNLPCFCGSGNKAKSCCLSKISKTVPIEQGMKLREYVDYAQQFERRIGDDQISLA